MNVAWFCTHAEKEKWLRLGLHGCEGRVSCWLGGK